MNKKQKLALEAKVRVLILKKLQLKIDERYLIMPKEDVAELLLADIVALADCHGDIEEATALRNSQYGRGQSPFGSHGINLEEITSRYACELTAYEGYRMNLECGSDTEEILEEVKDTLDSDSEFLEAKLHEMVMECIAPRLSEQEAAKMGHSRESLLDTFAHHIVLVAKNTSIEDAVEEAFDEFANYPKKHLVKKESIRKELERISGLCPKEIYCYRQTMTLRDRGADLAETLAAAKTLFEGGILDAHSPTERPQAKSMQDLVWDTITESAKKRFDYASFRATFEDMGNDHVADDVLFKVIAGYAAGDSSEEIALDINREFLVLGYSFEGVEEFVSSKETELKTEIRAADIALQLFDMGQSGPGTLVHIKSILGSA